MDISSAIFFINVHELTFAGIEKHLPFF